MASGNVNITIQDNGSNTATQVPAASLQVVIGCAVSGTDYQIVSTTSPNTLQSTFTAGPLPEAAAFPLLAGGTVLAMKVPLTSTGTVSSPTTSGTGTALGSFAVTFSNGAIGAYDDGYWIFKCVAAGTLGTAGITFQLSRDAGRNYGPTIPLGTALTFSPSNSGLILTLGSSSQTYA